QSVGGGGLGDPSLLIRNRQRGHAPESCIRSYRRAAETRISRGDHPMNEDALRDHLLQHAVRRGDFVLKSGRRSNWFIDSKATTCRPDGMLLVADAALALIPDDVTAIGGLTMGADAAA